MVVSSVCPFVILYGAELCKSTKLEVRVRMSLICQCCRGITGLNIVALIGDKAGDIQANLSITKNAVNVKVSKDLFYFVCDDRRGDKILSGITDFLEGNFLNCFFLIFWFEI